MTASVLTGAHSKVYKEVEGKRSRCRNADEVENKEGYFPTQPIRGSGTAT